MRWTRRVSIGEGFAASGLWLDSRRLVVLAGGNQAHVAVVDPVARKLVGSRSLDGVLGDVGRTPTELVALLAPPEGIGTARLAVIDAEGSVRSAPLPGLAAGFKLLDSERYVRRQEWPGLAVDAAGRRAFVVQASGPIAEIDLETLTVSMHPTRTLAVRRKALEGWTRSATWFAPYIAVTGWNASFDGEASHGAPTGLTLIDSRDWSARTVEPRYTATAVAGDTLLAFGVTRDEQAQRDRGMGLTGYALDGTQRFHLFGNTPVYDIAVADGYAYVGFGDNRNFRIIDPRLGLAVGKRVTTANSTIIAGGF
jgi:hypothetical protein